MGKGLEPQTLELKFDYFWSMSTQDIKSEIKKSLDRVPDSVLQTIFDLLKQAEKYPAEKVNLTKNLQKILSEDKALLERLAK